MSRKNTRSLERAVPISHALTRAARGDQSARDAQTDMEEENLPVVGEMLLSLFIPGETWYIETTTWPIIGTVFKVGRDFVAVKDAVRVHDDGRHGLFMQDGDHTGAEIEAAGTVDGIVVIPVDWIGLTHPWVHPIPKPH